jgi:hypothetical protein
LNILDKVTTAGRLAVLGAAIAVAGAPAMAAPTPAPQEEAAVAAPVVARAAYNEKKGALLVVGTGFDDSAVVRVNGVEVSGERKFRADKQKLRIKISAADLALKADGQNTVEIVQDGRTSGEITF